MILADKIIMLRKKNGWSQEELAAKMDVSRQSVSKWEGALSVPDLDKILQLSAIFGVSTDYLLKDEMSEEDYTPEVQSEEDSKVRRVSMQEASDFLAVKQVTGKRVALATLMCILSPIPLLLLGAASENPAYDISENLAGGVGVISLLIIVACAVAIFIACGMKTSRFEYLDKESIETEYGVSGMVRDRMEKYSGTYTKCNIIGACCCILAAVPLLASAFITEVELYIMAALSMTLLLAGIGVVFFVVAGTNHSSMQKLLEEGDYTKKAKQRSEHVGAISTSYWLIAVAIYLWRSFTTGDWDTTWIIWPVAGVLYAVVMSLYSLFTKSDK